MYARSVTVPSVGVADNATPCVLRRRFRASVTRRGSAERPRDGSPRPSAESGLDIVNRCMVFQDVASDGASVDGTLRDANGRPWPAGLATALPSTEATTVAKTARADGQMGESADPNERVRPTDDAAQDSRAGGLYASTRLTGAQRPSGRRHASLVEWPAAAPTSNDFCPDAILARDRVVATDLTASAESRAARSRENAGGAMCAMADTNSLPVICVTIACSSAEDIGTTK